MGKDLEIVYIQSNQEKYIKLAQKLGAGAFGRVYKGFNTKTGEIVAAKKIGIVDDPRVELPNIMLEIELLKDLDHSNIIRYHGFSKTVKFLYIIFEYCERGSLHDIMRDIGAFSEPIVAGYILQILHGLLFLHTQSIVHRDIKASNVLVTNSDEIKHFGIAIQLGVEGVVDLSVVGSPYWMAPEIIKQAGATTASDIWSLGALIVELFSGHPPYHTLDPLPALFKIVNDKSPPLPETISPVGRDFLAKCFEKDAGLRIGAKRLLKHLWMTTRPRSYDKWDSDFNGEILL